MPEITGATASEARMTTSAVEANPVIAYLSNSLPSATEPYVSKEIDELRGRGVRVIPCSIWRTGSSDEPKKAGTPPVLAVAVFRPWLLLHALWLCIVRFPEISDFVQRIFGSGKESFMMRVRALAHTCLGAELALQLRDQRVRHIVVHHGYMAAWIGMVAARLLHTPYSLTLHGSDLLVRPRFLDVKLRNCAVCFTVSEFNRRHLLEQHGEITPCSIVVRHMGVSVPRTQPRELPADDLPFNLLAVGRLHSVKDHAFLIRGCAALKNSGLKISCRIAGEGPERQRLVNLIRNLHLDQEVELLGHIKRDQLETLYRAAGLVVITSRSEGIPLTLMEAMALGRPVLAPAITGIPELILDGKTGFLYKPGSITNFVERVEFLQRTRSALGPVCLAAYELVNANFNSDTTLRQFGDVLLKQILAPKESLDADSLLQQVQL